MADKMDKNSIAMALQIHGQISKGAIFRGLNSSAPPKLALCQPESCSLLLKESESDYRSEL